MSQTDAAGEGDPAAPASPEQPPSQAEGSDAGVVHAPRRTGGGAAAWLAGVALVTAAAALAAAGYATWRQRAALAVLDSADRSAAATVRRLETELDEMRGTLAATERRTQAGARERETLEHRLGSLPERLGELERRLEAFTGDSGAARERWLAAEAEHYLEIANTELELADDFDGASAALALADARLREVASPRFVPVRELIADEQLALDSVEPPDIEGIGLRLGRLEARVPDLPVRGTAAPKPAPASETVPEAQPGFRRLVDGLGKALTSLVRIERRDTSVVPPLSDAERRLAQGQVELELGLARLGLARRDAALYEASLESVARLLRREFDADSGPVAGALALVDELAGEQIAPSKPDIGGSLARLRSLRNGGR